MRKVLYVLIALVAAFALVSCDTKLHTPAPVTPGSVTSVTVFNSEDALLHAWWDGGNTDWPGSALTECWYVVANEAFEGCKFSDPESAGDLDGISKNGVYKSDGATGWTKFADADKIVILSETAFNSFYTWNPENFDGWPGTTDVKHAWYIVFDQKVDGTIFTNADGSGAKLYGDDDLPAVDPGVWSFDKTTKTYTKVD